MGARGGDAEVVLVDGVRTPFAKAGKELATVPAAELGRIVLAELLARTSLDPASVDEVILGCAGQPADAPNIARVAALWAGVPRAVGAQTVQRNCASGMQALATACDLIRAGRGTTVLAGGTESMSHYPLQWSREFTDRFVAITTGRTWGKRLGALFSLRPRHLKPVVTILQGLTDPVCGLNMGQTAERLAREFGISRADQDACALESHRRAAAAQKAGVLDGEIVPVFVPPRYRAVLERDGGPRPDQTIEALAKLRPFFDPKYGTVTAGNSCPVSDGAAALLVMRADVARAHGYKPLARVRACAFAGLDPARMGLGPVFAIARLVAEARLPLSEIGLFELNEAFASQTIACLKAAASQSFAQETGWPVPLGEIDPARVNVNGGAIALGHPVGTSGARIVLTLAREMRRRGVAHGIATLCIGGGQGGAVLLEACDG